MALEAEDLVQEFTLHIACPGDQILGLCYFVHFRRKGGEITQALGASEHDVFWEPVRQISVCVVVVKPGLELASHLM